MGLYLPLTLEEVPVSSTSSAPPPQASSNYMDPGRCTFGQGDEHEAPQPVRQRSGFLIPVETHLNNSDVGVGFPVTALY
ncbi:hypothetical protein NQZ68_000760 [Dissostichus eleginoides]|nr:hypothetical protein NQZ68_000760 [Dissostichus eleginoides]